MSSLKEIIYDFLRRRNLAVLATISPEGKPESAVIEFSETDSLELIFDTHTIFRKYRNLQNNPEVALTIGWEDSKTVQYEGRAFEVSGDELERCKKIHIGKLPEAAKFLVREDIRFFKVIPTWVRYADLSQEPWQFRELPLAGELSAEVADR